MESKHYSMILVSLVKFEWELLHDSEGVSLVDSVA